MSEFLRDLQIGVRLLFKSPGFTVAAVLMLGIGISVNTQIFSVINALLLRPLPVSHPENLVRMLEVHSNNFVTWDLPYNFCSRIAAIDSRFSEVICQGEADLPLRDGSSTARVRVNFVSPNFFSSLGASVILGRTLNAEDERGVATNTVLSYGFWQRRFGGDRSIVGHRIILAGQSFTIIGVSPEAFNGLTVDTSPDLRVPAATDRFIVKADGDMSPSARPLFGQIFGRLRPGVTVESAAEEIEHRLHGAYREELDKIYPTVKATATSGVIQSRLQLESITNGVSSLRQQFSLSLKVLMAGVALLLLMACADVAGLLLGRAAVRAQEMGIRVALGASPARIVRQLLTEGLLLAVMGGIAGTLFAVVSLPLLLRGLPPIRDRGAVLQPLAVHIDIDFRVLAFTICVTFATAILFALSPALRCARTDVVSALKNSRTTTQQLSSRNVMVVGQVAVCTLILIGASLLLETLERMRSMNAGFDRDRVVTFTIDPTLRAYTPVQSRRFSKTMLERAGSLPGVAAASIAARGLMRGTGVKATRGAAGTHINAADFLNCSLNAVTPGYFRTMGIRVLAGRDFAWFDRDTTRAKKVIVNETLARRFFPGKSAIGQSIGGPEASGVAGATNLIIGVVSDAKYRSLREPIPPTIYSPVVDGFDAGFILHVRTTVRPEMLIATVQGVLRDLDEDMPFVEVQTLREAVDASLWQERLLAALSSIFGGIATLLAGIGLYSALDSAVGSRRREIGVRMALGAAPANIVGTLSREMMILLATGIAVGLAAYSAVAIWMTHILYEVQPWELTGITTALMLVGLVAALAIAPAAVRASRTDPALALRAE